MINIAILGLGKISSRIAIGIKEAEGAKLYAVASRNMEKSVAFKKEFGAQKAFDSYKALMKDEHVDLIYIATPNKTHFGYIMACLEHKKHVLCEKPLVATHDELGEIFTYAKKQGCFLMEAEKTIFTPLNQRIKQMIGEGVIGDVLTIEAGYAMKIPEAELKSDHWVFDQEFGGSMFDIGVYPICYANFIAHSFVEDVKATVIYDERGFDLQSKSDIRYFNGIQAHVDCGWLEENNTAIITGTKGTIITNDFWKTNEAVLFKNEEQTKISVPKCSDFKGEIEHAIHCIQFGSLESPIMGYLQSVEILKVLSLALEKNEVKHV